MVRRQFVANYRCWVITSGGERGIRTLGTLARTTVFETAPIDRSGTSPSRLYLTPRSGRRKSVCVAGMGVR